MMASQGANNNHMDVIYQIHDITKVYKNRAAGSIVANDGISLDIRRGEIVGLLGPNGAGKTTLIKQMINVTRPTAGQIILNGESVAQNPDIVPLSVSYLPQKPFALQDLTVEQALYYAGHLRGLSRADARQATAQLLVDWDLHRWRHRPVRYLSGGQQRLVGVASALIGERPILILDEPTNELDPSQRVRVWQRLSALNREQRVTIVLATHNVHEAEQVVHRVCILNDGRLVALGPLDKLKAQARSTVRLELVFDTPPVPVPSNVPAEIGQMQMRSARHWVLIASRAQLTAALDWVRANYDVDKLAEFNVHTMSLEDVYLQFVEEDK